MSERDRTTEDRRDECSVTAYRFKNSPSARQVFRSIRDAIFENKLKASVFELQISGSKPIIVVLGDKEHIDNISSDFDDSLRKGEAVQLPDHVVQELVARRELERNRGSSWEDYTPKPIFEPAS